MDEEFQILLYPNEGRVVGTKKLKQQQDETNDYYVGLYVLGSNIGPNISTKK